MIYPENMGHVWQRNEWCAAARCLPLARSNGGKGAGRAPCGAMECEIVKPEMASAILY